VPEAMWAGRMGPPRMITSAATPAVGPATGRHANSPGRGRRRGRDS
jgi:hypothetical protein